MIPFITRETTFWSTCPQVGSLGMNIFDSEFGVQIYPVKQPIQRNSVGSGHVSHSRTSTFDDHFDHRFFVIDKYTTALHIEKNLRL